MKSGVSIGNVRLCNDAAGHAYLLTEWIRGGPDNGLIRSEALAWRATLSNLAAENRILRAIRRDLLDHV